MKRALSIEGGAMRGMFTCGVLDVFLQNGIEFDAAAGISAGATFGCNFKSKQIGRAVRYNKQYAGDPRYCSVRSLIRTGNLYGVQFCYHDLPDRLDVFDRKTFQENPLAFYIGATNVATGQVEYHCCSDGGALDIERMRASASMPIVSRAVEIGGQLYLDGGIVEAVPLPYLEGLGYERHVVILTQPRGYRKKKSSIAPFANLLILKYPKIAEAMKVRHERYNAQMEDIERKAGNGSLFAIYPPEPLGISRTESDPGELERVYQIGRETAKAHLREVSEYLKQPG